jgi:hypothetical protein
MGAGRSGEHRRVVIGVISVKCTNLVGCALNGGASLLYL